MLRLTLSIAIAFIIGGIVGNLTASRAMSAGQSMLLAEIEARLTSSSDHKISPDDLKYVLKDIVASDCGRSAKAAE